MNDAEIVFVRFRSTAGGMLVPEELRTKLLAEAEERGTNLNAVIVTILARRFGIAFEPEGRSAAKSTPRVDVASLKVSLPIQLRQAVGRAAQSAHPPRSVPEEIRRALADHFGLVAVA